MVNLSGELNQDNSIIKIQDSNENRGNKAAARNEMTDEKRESIRAADEGRKSFLAEQAENKRAQNIRFNEWARQHYERQGKSVPAQHLRDESGGCDSSSGAGCSIMGGKIAKKTKRKRSRRTKKSRRHRKK